MQINENLVRERAYKIWESEGRPEGLADKHWSMACEYEDSVHDDQADSYSTLGQDSESGQDSEPDHDEKKHSPRHKPTHKKGNDHHH